MDTTLFKKVHLVNWRQGCLRQIPGAESSPGLQPSVDI